MFFGKTEKTKKSPGLAQQSKNLSADQLAWSDYLQFVSIKLL